MNHYNGTLALNGIYLMHILSTFKINAYQTYQDSILRWEHYIINTEMIERNLNT